MLLKILKTWNWKCWHAEQLLFSCLGSKVTVYRRKLQCFFFDHHHHSTLSCDIRVHRAGSQLKTFYPLALIFTIGHWLGAIKIRFGYIRLARRTVSSAFKSQAANIVFFTPPEAKNSNSVGLYHQGLARNKCLTCKIRSGVVQKKYFIPLPLYLPLAPGWGLKK